MRVLFVALVCSGAILGRAAFAQTDNPAVPAVSAQPAAPATTGAAAPAQPAAVAASPAPAVAAYRAPAAAAQQSAESTANLDEVVCKDQAPATGTRLGGGRECHSVREWNRREREAQELTRHQERGGMVHPGG